MEDHRARSDQLFALEAVDLEDGGSFPIERCETPANSVQPPQRATVVVFVVAYEHTFLKLRSSIVASAGAAEPSPFAAQ